MRRPDDTGPLGGSADPRPHSDLGPPQRRALPLLAVVTAIGSTGLAAGASSSDEAQTTVHAPEASQYHQLGANPQTVSDSFSMPWKLRRCGSSHASRVW